jgi:hypothetical protein
VRFLNFFLQRGQENTGSLPCDVLDAGVNSSDVSISADIEVVSEPTSPLGAGVLVDSSSAPSFGASGSDWGKLGAPPESEGCCWRSESSMMSSKGVAVHPWFKFSESPKGTQESENVLTHESSDKRENVLFLLLCDKSS